MGFSLAPIFATGITWSSQYIDVSGRVGTIFNMAFAVGEMTTPVLLNVLYDSHGMKSFVYIMLCASSLELIIYSLLQMYASCSSKGREERDDISQHSLLNSTEPEDDESGM